MSARQRTIGSRSVVTGLASDAFGPASHGEGYRLKPTGERVKEEVELMRPTVDDRDVGNERSEFYEREGGTPSVPRPPWLGL
jgi:hypothetical protein